MKGKLIVIEGCDGSGKSTQIELLKERAPKGTSFFKFPTYDEYGKSVTSYLKAKDRLDKVDGYQATIFYLHDMLCAYKSKLEKELNNGKTIVLDRYVTSNIYHQIVKLHLDDEDNDASWHTFETRYNPAVLPQHMRQYINWVSDLAYYKLSLPHPSQTFFLSMTANNIATLREKRLIELGEKDNTHNDIHENNKKYMDRVNTIGPVIANYLNWDIISTDDSKDGIEKILTPNEISDIIYNKICW